MEVRMLLPSLLSRSKVGPPSVLAGGWYKDAVWCMKFCLWHQQEWGFCLTGNNGWEVFPWVFPNHSHTASLGWAQLSGGQAHPKQSLTLLMPACHCWKHCSKWLWGSEKEKKKKRPCPHFLLPHLLILNCKTSWFQERNSRQMLAAAVCLKSTAWRIASWMEIHQAFYQLLWSKNPAVLHSDMPECCILSVWGLLFDNTVFKKIWKKKKKKVLQSSRACLHSVVSSVPHSLLNLFFTKNWAEFPSRGLEPLLWGSL